MIMTAAVFIFTNGTVATKLAKKKAKVKVSRGKVQNKFHNNPLVSFEYPMSKEPWDSERRYVRLISANQKYIIGLEITALPSGEQKYIFKKFLVAKASEMFIEEFAPQSM
jgi:hypothetical protein